MGADYYEQFEECEAFTVRQSAAHLARWGGALCRAGCRSRRRLRPRPQPAPPWRCRHPPTFPCPATAPQDCLPLGVGKGTHIKGAIVDKNARIGKFCKIINAEGIQVRGWMGWGVVGWRMGRGLLVPPRSSFHQRAPASPPSSPTLLPPPPPPTPPATGVVQDGG